MTFHLWIYFLDDWELDAESLQVGVFQSPGPPAKTGGGHLREYERQPSQYWETREVAMLRPPSDPDWERILVPRAPPERVVMPDTSPPRRPPPPPPKPVFTEEEREEHLSAMKSAGSLDELKKLSRTLTRFS